MTRRPGRPRLDENDESVGVNVRMTSRQYDETFKRAQRERVTVPEIIRRDVAAGWEKKKRL